MVVEEEARHIFTFNSLQFYDDNFQSLDNYEFIRMLGRGGFGKVMLSRERSSGKLYVMQVVKRRNSGGSGDGGGHHVLEMTSHPFLTVWLIHLQS